MKVALQTDGPVRLWHDRLRERLAAAGHALTVEAKPARRGIPLGLGALLAAERRLYGDRASLWQPTGAAGGAARADLVLEPYFDGVSGERALVQALLARRTPRVEIVDVTHIRRLAAGLPAVENPDVLSRALDDVLARTALLVVEAVRNTGAGTEPPVLSDAPTSGAPAPPPLFGARTLGGKLLGRLRPARARLPQWRVATRVAAEPGAARARGWQDTPFTELAHDGQRFQADPFLFQHEDRTWLFLEDFPHATRKGMISACEIDAAGRPGTPRVVLEEPFHLSYPFVFAHEHGREIYMLPETAAAGCIRLYRADPFPDRWVPDHVLVDNVEANDATLIEHGGRLWLFATLSGDGGSSWDALILFHAPHLLGPWTPHPGNPVLIDAGAARPAGAMWFEGDTLMRVAQDCRGAYGAGLAICRVDRLDGDGYAQTVVARLRAPAGTSATCVHTLSRAGAIEAIDLL